MDTSGKSANDIALSPALETMWRLQYELAHSPALEAWGRLKDELACITWPLEKARLEAGLSTTLAAVEKFREIEHALRYLTCSPAVEVMRRLSERGDSLGGQMERLALGVACSPKFEELRRQAEAHRLMLIDGGLRAQMQRQEFLETIANAFRPLYAPATVPPDPHIHALQQLRVEVAELKEEIRELRKYFEPPQDLEEQREDDRPWPGQYI